MLKTNGYVVFRLVCVRHGETDGNKAMKLQGHKDIPLNSLGKEQARRAGVVLSSWSWSRAYCSDLCRARLTAELILGQAVGAVPPLVQDSLLRERNFGIFEGMTISDVKKEIEAKKKSWPEYVPEGGESMQQVHNRFVAFFKSLCQSIYDKNTKNSNSCDANSVNGDTTSTGTCSATNNSASCNTSDSSCTTPTTGDTEGAWSLADAQRDACESILMVSHGVALREFFVHLQGLGCSFPSNQRMVLPNTSYSSFFIRYSPRSYTVMCDIYNNSDHINDIPQ